jgi:hypothetical protein
MPLNWTMTSQVNASAGIKVLGWSESGVGKTVLCATAPRPLVVSAESGLLSLRKANLEKLFGVGNPHITYDIPVLHVTTVQDLTDIYAWLTQAKEASYFDTVCLDSLSEIGEQVLNNAKRQVKDPRQAYGELIEKMEHLVRVYRDLPNKHVYMAAKAEPMKDELTGIVTYGPSMPGAKLGPKLPYFFDEVFKLGVNKDAQGNPFRYLQTVKDLQNVCKDRSGALDAMEPPNLAHVFNKILQGA